MKRSQGKVAALFLLPYLSIFVIFRFVPSVAGLFISFFKWNIIGQAQFYGLGNFTKLITDRFFYISLENTLMFILIVVPPLVIFSLFLAILLNQKLRFRNAARAISIIPYVLIPAVVGIIWNWLYENNFGILNYYIKKVGLRPVEWLTNDHTALVSVAIVIIWSYIGYNTVLFLAGLQGVPRELYEASMIDGANKLQTFFKITLPMLKPVTSMIITLTLVNTVQVFDQIYVMTNGGPGTSTLTLVQYMYNSAFQNYDIGYGSTLEIAVLIILILLIKVQSKFFKVEE
jgi:multiple sugar transport system permease protein